MVNLNSAENAHFMLWPDQFQKIRQIKASTKDRTMVCIFLFTINT